MSTVNPFQDAPPENPLAGKMPQERSYSAPISNLEAIRISRQLAAEANAGRSSYTMGMLNIVTISCAAILGVCGTSLQDIMTDETIRIGSVTIILGGVGAGLVFGAIVGAFVRFSLQTIFLSSMMGGLLGALTTPAAVNADNSPTAALLAAAIVGPLLILSTSYLFARLSRRTSHHDQGPAPTSPWETLPAARVAPAGAEEPAEESSSVV